MSDKNWLNQMVKHIQRKYGVIPPIQPTYQISPQNYMSDPNPSHIYYSSSTIDNVNPPHYPSPTYDSSHSPHNSSNINAISKEIEELKNYVLSLQNGGQKKKYTF